MSDPTPSTALGRVTRETIITDPRDLTSYLEKSSGIFKAALPDHLPVERFIRTIITQFSITPKLRQCTAFSILQGAVLASQIGLEIGVAGQGYLVPYGKTAQFVPGWQGLVGLLNNSGRATAWTGAVYEGDEFEFELGAHPKLKHVPGDNHGDPDLFIGAYACGLVNGATMPVVEYWRKSRLERHRNKNNKVGNAHYSFGNFEMYARKVVLLQVLKYLPRSIRVNNGFIAANADESGRFAKVTDDGVVIDVDGAEVDPTGDLANASQGAGGGSTAAAPAAAPEPALTPQQRAAATRKANAEKAAAEAAAAAPAEAKDEIPFGQDPEPVQEAELVPQEPAEVEDEAAIRKKHGDYLKQFLAENEVKWEEFTIACRKANILRDDERFSATTPSTAKLALIAQNAGFVVEAILAER